MADIKPIHVHKWMCCKAFGKEDPAQDDHPVRRSATIACWKKAISHFFHTTQKWNETSQTGNPTQSALVNKLIKVVKRQEIRGNGADAKADRALTEDGHCQIPELLRARDDARTTAMTNFQHHLIARMDDVAHVKKDTMQVSPVLIRSSTRLSRLIYLFYLSISSHPSTGKHQVPRVSYNTNPLVKECQRRVKLSSANHPA